MLQNNGLTKHAIINGEPQVPNDKVDPTDVQLKKNDLESNEAKRSSISSGVR